MRRRTLLASTAAGLAIGGGCLGLLSDCPDPSMRRAVEYESRDPAIVFEDGAGVRLVTRGSGVDDLTFVDADTDEAAWARQTPFDRYAVLATQITSSGSSSDLRVLGVDREDETTLHAYTCIADVGRTDDLGYYARLFRVPLGDQSPTAARLSHWEGGEKDTFDGPPEE